MKEKTRVTTMNADTKVTTMKGDTSETNRTIFTVAVRAMSSSSN
jgi:hypothetical protein